MVLQSILRSRLECCCFQKTKKTYDGENQRVGGEYKAQVQNHRDSQRWQLYGVLAGSKDPVGLLSPARLTAQNRLFWGEGPSKKPIIATRHKCNNRSRYKVCQTRSHAQRMHELLKHSFGELPNSLTTNEWCSMVGALTSFAFSATPWWDQDARLMLPATEEEGGAAEEEADWASPPFCCVA